MAAIATLPVRTCLIDGEAIVSNDSGLAVFDPVRFWPPNLSVVLCAFDLLELDGEDLRRLPIEVRKAGLAQLLRMPSPGIAVNAHYAGDGDIVSWRPASSVARASCRNGSARRTGPADPSIRLKFKNPAAPAMRREAEEDWRR